MLVSPGWIRFYIYLIVQTASWQREWEITEKKKVSQRKRDYELWMMGFLKAHMRTDKHWWVDRRLDFEPIRQSKSKRADPAVVWMQLANSHLELWEWKSEVRGKSEGNKRKTGQRKNFRLQTGWEERGRRAARWMVMKGNTQRDRQRRRDSGNYTDKYMCSLWLSHIFPTVQSFGCRRLKNMK